MASEAEGSSKCEILIRDVSGVVLIEIVGVFCLGGRDFDKLTKTTEERLARGYRLFLVNLASLRLLNSWGVGAFVRLVARVSEYGGKVLMCEASRRISQIFVITPCFPRPSFEFSDSCEEALQELTAIVKKSGRLV